MRQNHKRRKVYTSNNKTERVIVPLLKKHIEDNISMCLQGIKEIKVLDVGCGSQPFRSIIEKRQLQYFGLEVNKNEDADFFGEIDKEISKEVVDAGPFGFILCTEVLEHVADWQKTFNNFAKLLSAEGKILITAPFFYPLHEEPFDFYRPTLHVFKQFAEQNDFKIEKADKIGSSWDMLRIVLNEVANMSMKNRNLWNMLLKRGIKAWAFLGELILKMGFIQKKFTLSDRFYLSNVIVLSKK